ncbi:MAG: XRE family transcriptional regulator [Streptosporangiales bacterium]
MLYELLLFPLPSTINQGNVRVEDETRGEQGFPRFPLGCVTMGGMDDPSLPTWAARLRREREARGWSQLQTVRNMRATFARMPGNTNRDLPSDESLLRNYKGWEAGGAKGHRPEEANQRLLAATFGTVTAALFPPDERRADSALITTTGMDTLELMSRLRSSSVDPATLEAMRFTADRLCSDYPHEQAAQLQMEGHQWLNRITALLGERLSLAQHREVLSLAGLVALLVGCAEYDMGDRASAEATRRSALSLGTEADDRNIMGWAHEMASWFALTTGDYRRVIAAAEAGIEAAGDRGVSVQLAGQQAKAWARLGNRRQVELALDRGRSLLEDMPYPENVDHHFVVDPAKWDFYSMDTYRLMGEDDLAQTYATEVLRLGTGFDGSERSPMRNAEARISLGVVAARQGDIDTAVTYGQAALNGERQSLPSLLMCSRELGQLISERYPKSTDGNDYLQQLRTLGSSMAAGAL